MKKAMAAPNSTRRLQVVDMNGRVLIALTRPDLETSVAGARARLETKMVWPGLLR
jgi:hypothetical protein